MQHTGVRDRFPHMFELADPRHTALDSHAETTVGYRAVAPEVEIPSTHYAIYFDFDSAELNKDASGIIGDAVAVTRQMRYNNVTVSAHTDRAGASDYNQNLARKRALAVINSIKRFGGSKLSITIENHGEDMPAAKTVDGVKEGRNRRVEIFLR